MDNFPPNSKSAEDQARGPEKAPKRVEQVTSGEAVRRKPSLGKQFKHTFIGGDAKTAIQYVVFNVLIPAAKDALAEAGASGIEKLIYGDTRPKRGPSSMAGGLGHIAYNRMSSSGPSKPAPTMMPRRSRARHDFGEIIIPSRQEAEEVLERMFDIVDKYDSATVADLYDLTGLDASHTDHKWGWTELRGAHVGRARGGGYLLELPDPEPLG